jgi:hypothetical protein
VDGYTGSGDLSPGCKSPHFEEVRAAEASPPSPAYSGHSGPTSLRTCPVDFVDNLLNSECAHGDVRKPPSTLILMSQTV